MSIKAAAFYQSSREQTCPLVLVTSSLWANGELNLTPAEKRLLALEQFQANPGELVRIVDGEGHLSKVFVGAGEDAYALALAEAGLRLPQGAYQLNQALPQSALLAWALAQYRYNTFKKNDRLPRVLALNAADLAEVTRLAEAVFLVRDLINAPTNAMGPKDLSSIVAGLAEQFGAKFEAWEGDELLSHNFPAIHAVGRSSVNAPRLLSLVWGDARHPRLSLVGKGVCFDSGGLNLKPADNMRLMKKDMGGAANVLGLAQWIMASRLPVYLQVLIPAVENLPGPDAFKPGDILTMRNGLTVEIDNTDAEGRLVLADALVKAAEHQPELVIDFATLTGAARVALGTEVAVFFSNDEQVAQDLQQASKTALDPVWRLPLYAPYQSMFASQVADLANAAASPYAGAITAALFLQHFVDKAHPWIHFDIMAWNLSSKPGKPEGGEAMGIRAVAAYLKEKYSRG